MILPDKFKHSKSYNYDYNNLKGVAEFMFLFLKFQQLKEKLSSLVWGPRHFCFIPFSHQKMSLSKAFEILSDPHLRWRHFNYGQLSIELKFCIKCLIIWILDTLKLNVQPLVSWLRMSSFPILEIILICAQTYNCYLFLLITWINWRLRGILCVWRP